MVLNIDLSMLFATPARLRCAIVLDGLHQHEAIAVENVLARETLQFCTGDTGTKIPPAPKTHLSLSPKPSSRAQSRLKSGIFSPEFGRNDRNSGQANVPPRARNSYLGRMLPGMHIDAVKSKENKNKLRIKTSSCFS